MMKITVNFQSGRTATFEFTNQHDLDEAMNQLLTPGLYYANLQTGEFFNTMQIERIKIDPQYLQTRASALIVPIRP